MKLGFLWGLLFALPICLMGQVLFPEKNNDFGLLPEKGASHASLNSSWPVACGSYEQSKDSLKLLSPNKCLSSSKKFNLNLNGALSTQTHEKRFPLGEVLDNLGNSSNSTLVFRVHPETGRQWNNLQPVLQTELGVFFSPQLYAHLKINLQRNLDAWHDDPIGLNLPKSTDELNINEPSLGYFLWQSSVLDAIVGRFPVHWSPSPSYGLALSQSVPYHDGLHLRLKSKMLHYLYFVSGFNPWLSGTPDSFNGSYPVGSEEYLQRNPGLGGSSRDYNSRNRVYVEPYKTLFAHRLELHSPYLTLGLSEFELIGGKVPSLRDGSPLIAFHNNFNDGYANGAVSLDIKAKLPYESELFGETFIDEVHEADNKGNPTTLGLMLGFKNSLSFKGKGLTQALHWIKTDPMLYNNTRPYLKLTSRNIIKSNYIPLGSNPFVDTYVIDYPLGYFRGPDALDFWYNAQLTLSNAFAVQVSAAWLQKGVQDTYSVFTQSTKETPTGEVEEEFRFSFSTVYTYKQWQFNLGYHIQNISSENNVKDADIVRSQVTSSLRWDFSLAH